MITGHGHWTIFCSTRAVMIQTESNPRLEIPMLRVRSIERV